MFPRLHAGSDNSLYTGLTWELLSIQSHIIFIKCSTCNDFIVWNRKEIIIWVDVWACLWILGMKRKLHEFYKVNPHLSHMVAPLKIFWIHLPQKDIWLSPGSLNIFFCHLILLHDTKLGLLVEGLNIGLKLYFRFIYTMPFDLQVLYLLVADFSVSQITLWHPYCISLKWQGLLKHWARRDSKRRVYSVSWLETNERWILWIHEHLERNMSPHPFITYLCIGHFKLFINNIYF